MHLDFVLFIQSMANTDRTTDNYPVLCFYKSTFLNCSICTPEGTKVQMH